VSIGADITKYAVTSNRNQSGGKPNRLARDYIQQDRQYTCKVTYRCVRVTIVAVEKQ